MDLAAGVHPQEVGLAQGRGVSFAAELGSVALPYQGRTVWLQRLGQTL